MFRKKYYRFYKYFLLIMNLQQQVLMNYRKVQTGRRIDWINRDMVIYQAIQPTNIYTKKHEGTYNRNSTDARHAPDRRAFQTKYSPQISSSSNSNLEKSYAKHYKKKNEMNHVQPSLNISRKAEAKTDSPKTIGLYKISQSATDHSIKVLTAHLQYEKFTQQQADEVRISRQAVMRNPSNISLSFGLRIKFFYEAVRYYDFMDSSREIPIKILDDILLNQRGLKQNGFSVLSIRLYRLKLRYQLKMSGSLKNQHIFDQTECRKLKQLMDEQKNSERVNQIKLFINSLAYHYETNRSDKIELLPFTNHHQLLVQSLSQQMHNLQVFKSEQNRAEYYELKLTITQNKDQQNKQFRHHKIINRPYQSSRKNTYFHYNYSAFRNQRNRKFKQLCDQLISEQQRVSQVKIQDGYLCAYEDFNNIIKKVNSSYQNLNEVCLPFINLSAVYFPLNKGDKWIDIFGIRSPKKYVSISSKTWDLLWYFSIGIKIQSVNTTVQDNINVYQLPTNSKMRKESQQKRTVSLNVKIREEKSIEKQKRDPYQLKNEQRRSRDLIQIKEEQKDQIEQEYIEDSYGKPKNSQTKHLTPKIETYNPQKYKSTIYTKKLNDSIQKGVKSKTPNKAQHHIFKQHTNGTVTKKALHLKETNPQFRNYYGDGRGLKNMGNTCYMNSVLQCLHKTSSFNKAIGDEAHKYTDKEDSLAYEYQRLMTQLWDENKLGYYEPKKIKKLIENYNSNFLGYQQQDAIEFLTTFLSMISDELNTSPKKMIKVKIDQKTMKEGDIYISTKYKDEQRFKSIIEDTFTGRYRITYTCLECKKQFKLFEKFNIHYVPIPAPQGQKRGGHNYLLSKCIKDFEAEEQLDIPCDDCQKMTQQTKKMELFQINKVLVVGLKRFHEGQKNSRMIDVDDVLIPQQRIVSSSGDKKRKFFYELYGAIIHSGSSLHSGHYTAICYNYFQKQFQKQWMEYNDQTVKIVKKDEINNRSVYALFYKQVFSDSS